MPSFTEASDTLKQIETHRKGVLTGVMSMVKTTPEYQAYTKAYQALETRGEQYISASHPASEVDPQSQVILMGKLEAERGEKMGALQQRLLQDGLDSKFLPDVMKEITAGVAQDRSASL